MITRKLERAGQVGVPFQGVFFLGDGFPMALPWAGREVPLTGRQIVNHPENSDKPKNGDGYRLPQVFRRTLHESWSANGLRLAAQQALRLRR